MSLPPTRGMRLWSLRRAPDLVVGDFDSLGRRPSHPNVIQLPSAKDDTDMVYACGRVWTGASAASSCWGRGGRLEHTLANLQALSC